MRYDVIIFEQPAGSFLVTVMPAGEVIRISRADPRRFDSTTLITEGGIQRELSRKRVREIAAYADTVDAAFPTPILLAINEGDYRMTNGSIEVLRDHVADIVDGQHRVEGLKLAVKKDDFVVPVVFLLDPTEEQKALMFATINGKQTKVPASLIYELFGVTKTRSPQKTAHEIARAMNSAEDSPWYRRLKMLGKKTPGSSESLSQGTFVKFLLQLISKNPDHDRSLQKDGGEPVAYGDCVFNEYYLEKDDSTILRVLINVFSAAKRVWPVEWDDPVNYTLTKTNGFTGIMKALPDVVGKGKRQRDLSVGFFEKIFSALKADMVTKGIKFTVDHFAPSSVGENRLKDLIVESMDKV